MKNRIVSGAGAIVAGLLISVGPQTIFKLDPPMEDGTWMTCHWTGRAELGLGLLIAALGILLLLFSSAEARLGLSLAAVLAGVLAVLYPAVLIGGCGMENMRCRSVTFPALYIIGSLTMIGFALNSVYLALSVRNRKKGHGS